MSGSSSGENALNVVGMPTGTRLQLNDGRIVALVDNPEDGVWLVCQELSTDGEPDSEAELESIFVHDVVGVARQAKD